MAESPSSPHRWTFDVFLSFRGEDTRKNFLSHLSDALERKGINAFKDDKKLKRGRVIAPALLKAIRESRYSIVVLSKTYASSGWCLDELVEIVECQNKYGHEIFPVFCYVDPSDVRKQNREFEEAFVKHEKDFCGDDEKIQRWRNALTKVGNISGWHLHKRQESDVIREIVKEISTRLDLIMRRSVDDLIGINKRLEDLNSKIRAEPSATRMIGICGSAGIGKTALARAAYDLLSSEFDSKSFLANVLEVSGKSHHLFPLQQQIISQILMDENLKVWNNEEGEKLIRARLANKRVLIVLDNVDHINQLKFLAGNHDWFGSGSRIIITSRDERLLKLHGVDDIFTPTRLNEDEALELFSMKAFKKSKPPEEFIELCKKVVKYSNGLPLSLEALGFFLYGRKSVPEWEGAINRLRKDFEKEILDHRFGAITSDKLDEAQKKILLEIVSSFDNADMLQDLPGDGGIKKSFLDGTNEEPRPKRLKKILSIFRWGKQSYCNGNSGTMS